jgi:phenylalanyl-tRNA synthetase beta chain
MNVSLNWIRQYIDFDLPSIDALVERIGAQLGAVEGVEDLSVKYRGVVIARVVACHKHENSDHLNVCLIDDGGKTEQVSRDDNGYVQVVCGATNVREGILVAWLPPGSTVPDSVGKDPFVLTARELRGVVSNGMLASAKELALGDNHDGILELDGDIKAGDNFAEAYGLNDQIIDIENKMFTHRPDCFGQLGVAREIAGISGQAFHSPDWFLGVPEGSLTQTGDGMPLEVSNELPGEVPRFMVVPLSTVKVAPSPVWLQTYLLRVGVRPISNVVDITNYVMLLTGQPLHAYDYDKVRALEGGDSVHLVVRNPKSTEEITLLNGKTIKPRPEAIMIATESNLLGIGGVMGGAATEVDAQTRNIILECASFDMYSIRRTAMAHGLFTDAVTRNNKGQSPLQNDEVIAKAVSMLRELAGAQVAGPVIDNNHVDEQSRQRRWVHPPVPITTQFVNARLGLSLTAEDMQRLLQNVECQVTIEDAKLTVTAPFWRSDIETREDVVEEIGRLYGFDKLPLELPKRSIEPAKKDALLELKSRVRTILAKAGANEVLTYSFVHGDLLVKAGQDPADAFQVGNALSPDLQYYRLSLTPSLLDKIHPNIKAGYDEFAIFEMGKGHNLQHATDDDGLPMEFEMLDLVYTAHDKVARPGAAYYDAVAFLCNLAAEFGLQLEFRPIASEEAYPVVKPYDSTRSAAVFVKETGQPLGMVGEYKASVRRALKLPVHTAGFGIGLTQLLQAAHPTGTAYVPLSRFPKVTQDITLKVPASLTYHELFEFVRAQLTQLQPEQTTTAVHPIDIYQKTDELEWKQITFRITISSFQKTLRDTEVSALLSALANTAEAQLGAQLI